MIPEEHIIRIDPTGKMGMSKGNYRAFIDPAEGEVAVGARFTHEGYDYNVVHIERQAGASTGAIVSANRV